MDEVQKIRVAIVGLITLALALIFSAASIFLVVSVGLWALAGNDDLAVIKALGAWVLSLLVISVWSGGLRKGKNAKP